MKEGRKAKGGPVDWSLTTDRDAMAVLLVFLLLTVAERMRSLVLHTHTQGHYRQKEQLDFHGSGPSFMAETGSSLDTPKHGEALSVGFVDCRTISLRLFSHGRKFESKKNFRRNRRR